MEKLKEEETHKILERIDPEVAKRVKWIDQLNEEMQQDGVAENVRVSMMEARDSLVESVLSQHDERMVRLECTKLASEKAHSVNFVASKVSFGFLVLSWLIYLNTGSANTPLLIGLCLFSLVTLVVSQVARKVAKETTQITNMEKRNRGGTEV